MANETQQLGMWDKEAPEDEKLEAMALLSVEWEAAKSGARSAHFDSIPKFKPGELQRAALILRVMATYKKSLNALWEAQEYGEGDRVRIGNVVVPTISRAGGGITVPTWTKTMPGKAVQLPLE